MIGLPEIDKFDCQSFVGHDVGGFQIQVWDLVFREISESLGDEDAEVEFGVEGHGVFEFDTILK